MELRPCGGQQHTPRKSRRTLRWKQKIHTFSTALADHMQAWKNECEGPKGNDTETRESTGAKDVLRTKRKRMVGHVYSVVESASFENIIKGLETHIVRKLFHGRNKNYLSCPKSFQKVCGDQWADYVQHQR